MVFKRRKETHKQSKVLFIDASDQIRSGRAQNFLEPEHVTRIFEWFKKYRNVQNYVKIAALDDIRENDFNLNIPLYVEKMIEGQAAPRWKRPLTDLNTAWQASLQAEERFKAMLKGFMG